MSEKPPKELTADWLIQMAVTEHGLLLNWYYERFQAVGRGQNRLIWTGVVFSLAALLIHFAPDRAKELQFLGIRITALAPILPTIIFLILSALAGNLSTMRDPLNKIGDMFKSPEIRRHFKKDMFWPLDRNLNVLDYLAMAADEYWPKGRLPMYPMYIGVVFISGLLQIPVQAVQVLEEPFVGQSILLAINLVSGIYCYMLSRRIFLDKLKNSLK